SQRRRAQPRPHDASRKTEIVEPGDLVAFDARGQNLALPSRCGRFEAFELREHARECIGTCDLRAGSDALPLEQEAHEVARFYGFDLAAQPVDRVAVDA